MNGWMDRAQYLVDLAVSQSVSVNPCITILVPLLYVASYRPVFMSLCLCVCLSAYLFTAVAVWPCLCTLRVRVRKRQERSTKTHLCAAGPALNHSVLTW